MKPKPLLPLLAGIVALLLLAAGAFWFLRSDFWRAARADDLLRRAETLLARGDREGAIVLCGRSLRLRPDNPAAPRLLLRAYPATSASSRLLIRSRIADLDPADAENLFQIAAEGIAAGRPVLAGKALADLLKIEGESDRALELLARHHTACGNGADALRFSRRLLERQPDHLAARLMAAIQETRSPDAPTVTRAEQTLADIARTPGPQQIEAARTLRQRKTARGAPADALEWAETAARADGAIFDDALAAADIRIAAGQTTPDTEWPALVSWTAGSNRNLLRATLWLEAKGRPDLFDRARKEGAFRGIDPITLDIAAADALARRKDWKALLALVEESDWGKGEPLRLAVHARALRALGSDLEWSLLWRKALDTTGSSPERSEALSDLVATWEGWADEHEEFLRKALDASPANIQWATRELFNRYLARRATTELRWLSSEQMKHEPDNEMVRNNYAYFSLLSDAKTDEAHAIATALQAKYPEDPIILSTHALSLLKRGKKSDALRAFDPLPAPHRARPDIAPVYAAALAANGDREQAAALCQQLDPHALFPEERDLLKTHGLLKPARSLP